MGETFRYVTTTGELVTEIGTLLAKGESVVALGHRNSGKVFLKEKVKNVLHDKQLTPIVSIRFQSSQPLSTRMEASQRVCAGVQEFTGQRSNEEIEHRDLLA